MSNTFVEPWTEARVQDIASDVPRSIAIGPFGSRLKAELYVADGFPVIRGQDIGPGKGLLEDNLVYVPEVVAESLSGCIVSEGDLIFPHRGAIGQVGIVGQRQFLLSSSMMKLTCNRTVIDPGFLFYYFRGPGRDELLTRASTVGTPGIGQPLKSLRGIPIRYPGLPQQQAIAEVLGALDDKIAANAKLAVTIDAYLAASLIAALDGGFETVNLGSIASVNASTVKPQIEEQLRYLDISSVGVGSHEFPNLMSWEGAPSRARRSVKPGDTVWSTVRPNRRSHSLNLSSDDRLVGSTGLAVLSPKAVGFAYLYELSKRVEFTDYLEKVAEGSAYPAVRADRFELAPVPLIGTDDLAQFESIAAPMRWHAHSLQTENKKLAATRDALLPQLMSGKLRVRDAEKVVEAVV